MHSQKINHTIGIVLIFLALAALFAVLSGYTVPPQPDEGVAAHIFQISLAIQALGLFPFLATANWNRALTSLRPSEYRPLFWLSLLRLCTASNITESPMSAVGVRR